MLLQLNFKSGKPVYLQVVDQIQAAAIVQAHHLQVGRDDFLNLVNQRLDAFEAKPAKALGIATAANTGGADT